MTALKCDTRNFISAVVPLTVFGILFFVFLTLSLSFRAFSDHLDCDRLNPNLKYSISETNCFANNNNSVLVQINNCPNIEDLGFQISHDNSFNFSTSTKCWYSQGNVDCNVVKSNTIYPSNMTVWYSEPLEVRMWNNYASCLNDKTQLLSSANAGGGIAGGMGIVVLFSIIVICVYFCECNSKKKTTNI